MKKVIWTYWHQGFDDAPLVVKKCIKQVGKLNPGYTLHLLDEKSVYEYADVVQIPTGKWSSMQLPHRSDLLRTQLLIRHGGIWMDPTVFVMQPFDEWIPEYMKAGVFFFYKPGPDRILANWLIAAEPNNYVLTSLYESLIRYWNENHFINLGRESISERWLKKIINGRSLELSQFWLSTVVRKGLKIYPYMIYHFMVYRLIKRDYLFRKIWNEMPKVSADGPHRLKRLGLMGVVTDEGRELIDQRKHPVFKLDWKLEVDLSQNTLLNYLFNQGK